jgi:hypothetical protein
MVEKVEINHRKRGQKGQKEPFTNSSLLAFGLEGIEW